jgi:hypothetical protein
MVGQGEMNGVYLVGWLFGTKVGVDPKCSQRQPVCTCLLFSNLDKKVTGFDIWSRFGSDLDVPNIWISGHLDR